MLNYVQKLVPYFGCLPFYAGKVVVLWVFKAFFFFFNDDESSSLPCLETDESCEI